MRDNKHELNKSFGSVLPSCQTLVRGFWRVVVLTLVLLTQLLLVCLLWPGPPVKGSCPCGQTLVARCWRRLPASAIHRKRYHCPFYLVTRKHQPVLDNSGRRLESRTFHICRVFWVNVTLWGFMVNKCSNQSVSESCLSYVGSYFSKLSVRSWGKQKWGGVWAWGLNCVGCGEVSTVLRPNTSRYL